MQPHQEKFENLPEDLRLTEACDDAGFIRCLSWTTLGDNSRHPVGRIWLYKLLFLRDDERSKPNGCIRANTRIGPVLEGKVTHHSDRYGIEIEIDSIQTDVTPSWIVNSRRVNKCVTELPE